MFISMFGHCFVKPPIRGASQEFANDAVVLIVSLVILEVGA